MLFKSVKCLLLNVTNYIIRSGPKFRVENMAQLFEYNSENNAFKVTGRVHNSIKFGTDRQTCLCLLHSRLEGRGMRQIDPGTFMSRSSYANKMVFNSNSLLGAYKEFVISIR